LTRKTAGVLLDARVDTCRGRGAGAGDLSGAVPTLETSGVPHAAEAPRGTQGEPRLPGGLSAAQAGRHLAGHRSYVEIEITPSGTSIFERSGEGQTGALVELLSRYGLKLREKVSSPCG